MARFGYECDHCGLPMFYLSARPVSGSVLSVSDVYFEPNFSRPKNGEKIKCQFCLNPMIGLPSSGNVVELALQAEGNNGA